MSTLTQRDQKVVWHPYAPPQADPLFGVVSAEGVRIRLDDGRELIDGMSSWWSTIHGYRHPAIEAALKDQLERLPHVMFGGLTHEPAVELCERLVSISPDPLERVFLSDSGSVAVEVAIKMALQFWQSRGRPERRRLLTLRGGYHGDTFGAMAVCDPVTGMHGLFEGSLPSHLFAPRPECRFGEGDAGTLDHDFEAFERLFMENESEIAAVILEPIVQGAGGMWFYSADYLRRVREICDRFDVLLIADEIATGLGRTGKLFACEHAGISPDILCVGKALTGGTMTLAATLVNRKVSTALGKNSPGVFMHGPTFMGNPLACAAANASLGLLEDGKWQPRVEAIGNQLSAELEPCRSMPAVADVRVIGSIGVVELREPVDMSIIQPAFVEEGVWLRPFGKLVYTMPPYTIGAQDLSAITRAIASVISNHS
ncbi:MAG: adenosylmethionine--8-amino-7-oxononanoate transaminase [Myxococcales bacterium]|nr:adenosylmethionine--8-amino-7-oxononanoate transaminase [Myxococcales bacterium]HIK85729.1 adenosylmethionine--8-amino-7-oxononanoate transaminase [Myxococcales bacterium]